MTFTDNLPSDAFPDIQSPYAPIALFVYNRPNHTAATVTALLSNTLAKSSNLFVFCDGAKSASNSENVIRVRDYVKKITGFKSVTILERSENIGLARSIINGVTQLCEKYGKVIVLEDDLITSVHFLQFMNDGLIFYHNSHDVMHISGYRYPAQQFGNDDTFFLTVPMCWGWATWDRAWKNFANDLSIIDNFNKTMIYRFDFDNSYRYWDQLLMNKTGELNTWFVFWYAQLFLRNGLSLFPSISLVQNIGLDESGTNSARTDDFTVELAQRKIDVNKIPLTLSLEGYKKHKRYFRGIKIKSFVKKLLRRFFLFKHK